MSAPTLLLVDGSSYVYRAYHAMANLSAPNGEPTGAIFGVLNMLRRLETDTQFDYAAVIFDAKGKNFRHELFPAYKANRPPMPEDLRAQITAIHQLTALYGWPVLSIGGVEADDVIATLSTQAQQAGMQVLISSGDKDITQLVNDHITMWDTMQDVHYDRAHVIEKFGVPPELIIDYLSLVGDKADNVPGVPLVGPKRAAEWLNQYGSLHGICQNAAQLRGKAGENFRAAQADLALHRQLICLKHDVDLSAELPQGIQGLVRRAADTAALLPQLTHYHFQSLIKALGQPQASASTIPAAIPTHYRAITDQAALDALCQQLAQADVVGFDTETTSLNAMDAQLVGMSFSWAAGQAAYIPLGHHPQAAATQLPIADVLSQLKPWFENPKAYKVGQNLKYDRHVLKNYQLDLAGVVGDAMLASYVTESHLKHGLDDLALRHLNIHTTSYESLCGKGARAIGFADVALEDACPYACQDADLALRLHQQLLAQMNPAEKALYQQLELPIAAILFHMERTGVLIDAHHLQQQSHRIGGAIVDYENQAYALAGQPFNLNSPKQLQTVLFEKLQLPTAGIKKTAQGSYSTAEDVLERLATDYELPRLILQHRSLSKLKSTYTDKLPRLIRSDTGRVHTTYAQAVAITGRLASNNPNLQNIPIRSEEGRRVRRAFIAPAGFQIVSADYSQIELRIMAHLSEDATLIQAFLQGEDIHRRTAAEIFDIAAAAVSAEERRYAKTINFGLIYGMSQYGLARALNISNAEAKHFIERYFARYPGVANYMDNAQTFAKTHGYVETVFGRRLYLPDIRAGGIKRAAALRAAINAPMQGTASDLIKRAMIAVDHALKQADAKSRLIMQVHDELVLEVADDEWDDVRHLVTQHMSQAGTLRVPLPVAIGRAANWDEAH